MHVFLLFLFSVYGITCFGQVGGYTCDVYQYKDNKRADKTIVLTQTYNSAGKIVSEVYKGHGQDMHIGSIDATYTYFYNDTFLIKRICADYHGDSTKTFYNYNNKGQLESWEYYTDNEPYNWNTDKPKHWEKKSEVFFTYDEYGRKTVYDATKLHYSSQNKYTWAYDNQGRLLSHKSYDTDELLSSEDYTYFDGGYSYTRIWYDSEGSPKRLLPEATTSVYTFTFLTNADGRVVKETTKNQKGDLINSATITYNKAGKIKKKVFYDGKNKTRLTHLYVYR